MRSRVVDMTVFLASAITLIGLTACTASNKTSKEKNRPEPILLAWNEDTVVSYAFGVLSNKKFTYTISTIDSGQKKEVIYLGTIDYKKDTIWLKYNNEKPAGFTEYILFDGSGMYLIQPLKDNKKRVFMRRQRIKDPHGRNIYGEL